jgi:NDP-sugar pyrophosphorylase family protein
MSDGWQALVLAGGRATRLGARARALPKYLLPVAGKPFAERQLALLAAAGCTRAVLCVGHLGDRIRAALGTRACGVELAYSEDGPEPAGTGGALRLALPLLGATFVVTYGDSYLPFDYGGPLRDLEAHPEAAGTMSVYENHDAWDASNVRVAGERVVEYRKGGEGFAHIDYGAIAMRRHAVESLMLPPPAHDLAELLRAMAATGTLRAHPVAERFYEIGTPAGLALLEMLLGRRQ